MPFPKRYFVHITTQRQQPHPLRQGLGNLSADWDSHELGNWNDTWDVHFRENTWLTESDHEAPKHAMTVPFFTAITPAKARS